MENKRDSMVFYRSFYESLKGLSPMICAEVYDAIFKYGLDFEEPEFTEPVAKAMFTLIKPQLDANIKRYENGKIPKQKQNSSEKKQNGSKTEANVNVNVNVNDNVNGNVLLVKETKPKKSILERKNEFKLSVVAIMEREKINPAVTKEFFEYWTEPNQANTKLRFELEKTYDISRRLNTWIKNNEKFSGNNKVGTYAKETRTDSQNTAKEQFRANFNQ